MPPPRKRPRLHFIGSASPEPDLELATARKRNDNLLKKCWESVFQRYERDFSGIGDEIGIISGEVEVDNGHLRSMQNEKDVGETPDSPSKFDGRRMLRAITAAPTTYSDSTPDADEVLQSIETIADNALMSEYSSEDNLFDEQTGAKAEEDDELLRDAHTERYYNEDYGAESSDDLFDDHPATRSQSVDSLFAPGQSVEISTFTKQESPMPELNAGTSLTPVSESQDLTSITLREQVRKILQEEKERDIELMEEKVEPAWRLPVQIPTRPYSRPVSLSLPRIASTDHSPVETEDEMEGDPNMTTSIWDAPTRTRRPKRAVAAERSLKRIRAESEDPLQEGFSSESELSSSQPTVGVASQQNSSKHTTSEPRSQPSSRQASVEHLSHSAPERFTVERLSQTSSRQRSATHSPQQPPAEPSTITRYTTRHSLRQTPLKHKASRTILSPQHNAAHSSFRQTSVAVDLPPVGTASMEPSYCQGSRSPEATQQQPSLAAAETDDNDNHVRYSLDDKDDTALPRASSLDGCRDAVHNGSEAEQAEATIAANSTLPINKASGRRSIRLDIPKISRVHHPWEVQTSRSGRPITNLSKSLRRSAGRKHKEGSGKSSLATKHVFANGSAIATLADINNLDPVLAEIERKKILRPMSKGLCVYCKANYQDANAAGAHWDRVLANFAAGTADDDDPHDMEFLHSVRSKVGRRSRAPKTLLGDFRLMIELHEGNELSFQQIAASNLLCTTKHAPTLAKEYQIYRQDPPAETVNPWTEELEAKLWEVVAEADEKTTMSHIRRQLVGNNIEEMSMFDLGSKLAERFLEEYRSRSDASGDSS
ncbi:hypothetical protein PMZ80_006761 [Knufia obscura]|uniref:Uncharacterized protein n=1 Tax=Knufia obscura TaxID=1635080 RepID=A0ABR0RM72_9EURO|nr:hypothetical protein PMZ80_006761 [Knufia obscura]